MRSDSYATMVSTFMYLQAKQFYNTLLLKKVKQEYWNYVGGGVNKLYIYSSGFIRIQKVILRVYTSRQYFKVFI